MRKNTFFVIFLILISIKTFSQINWQTHTVYNSDGKTDLKTICVGNIDSDNYPDILTGGLGIRWLKNLDGTGNFSSSQAIDSDGTGSYGISDVFIADIDGDGFNDVVYTGNYVYWARNLDGNGNFGAKINLGGTVNAVQRMQVLDVDNDGDVDIVYSRLTNYPSYEITLLKNNGNGTFEAPQVIISSEAYKRFFVVDISGDNLSDVVYETQSSVVYYQQNADGTFILKENMGSTSNHMGSGIRNTGNVYGGDIDGDGDKDIVNFYENGGNNRSIRWFRNDNNVFANSQILITLPASASSNSDYFSFRLEDIDQDGKIDIVTQFSSTNQILWYKNLGNNTFGTAQIISNTVLDNKYIFITDINGDGKKDIVTADDTNNQTLWFDNVNGNGSSFTKHTIDDYINIPFAGDVGDINGNGTKDILLYSSNTNKLGWYENAEGQGNFKTAQNNLTTSLQSYNSAILVDANNDGHNDLVASSGFDATNKIVWLKNDGQGNFSNEQMLYSSGNYKIFARDIDNDGDKDIIAYLANPSATSAELKIFKNNGNGFDAPLTYTHAINNFRTIEATDMDADGDLDMLVFVSNSAGMYWIENTNGQGNYTSIHQISLSVSSMNFSTGDFNNDGLKDVVYMYTTPQGLDYLRRVTINTDGTFGTPVNLMNLGGLASFGLLKLVDLDYDGDLDILVEDNNANDNLIWYENLGNDTVVQHLILTNFEDIDSLCFLEDINADGKVDFIATVDGSIFWYENLGINQNIVKGTVSLDLQSNNCTTGSVKAQQVLMTTVTGDNSVSTFTQPNGEFVFKVDAGSHTTSVTSLFPNFASNPISILSQFENVGGQSVANFCLVPNQFFEDLEISFYPLNDARPGFVAKYLVVAKNKGTNTITTGITFNYDNSKIQFVAAHPTIASQTSGSITFQVNNLMPFQAFNMNLDFQVSTIPTTNIGDIITFTVANELNGDQTPENNSVTYNQTIVGAYDPNDMQVLEGEEVHVDNSGEFLHYIIRFQNTGNYHAERVVVTTDLDENLDWKTLELESYSHPNRIEIVDGNSINFIFDAIYLPAVNVDEQGSNGYMAFKVKPKPSIAVGDIVQGIANIYFDHNPAIITNPVTTEFVDVLQVPSLETSSVIAYPNPVTNLLHFTNSEEYFDATVYNTIGQVIAVVSNPTSIDFTEKPFGIYLVKITTPSGKNKVIRIIKK